MDTVSSVLKSAQQFFAGTALSRLSGLLRDMAMAMAFGASPEIGAFMVAYRFANLFRRLLGEGNLQSAFVPHFETLRKVNEKAAFCFYRDSVFSLSTLVTLFILSLEGLFWGVLSRLPEGWQKIIELTLWMTPALFFICLSALGSALLQCQKQYLVSASAPILFNLVWIIFASASSYFLLPQAILFLSIGITLAFAAQWSLIFIKAHNEVKKYLNLREFFQPRVFSPEWKKILRPMVLGTVGVGAMQINSALDAIFARISDLSGPTYLWYSIRVQQLPLALFGIALSGALLPPLSRALEEGDLEQYRMLFSDSLRQVATLMIACSFGIFALGACGLNLLYGRGHFSSDNLQNTLYCLWGYGTGLVPASFVLLLSVSSYAKKSYGWPASASLISLGVNISLNTFLVFGMHWGPVSIALTTSISAWVNYVLLIQKQRIGPGVWNHFIKVTLAGATAAALSIGCASWLGDSTLEILRGNSVVFSRPLFQQIKQFAGISCVFLTTFLIMTRLLHIEEPFLFFRKTALLPGNRSEDFPEMG